jgi:hypothetical protein
MFNPWFVFNGWFNLVRAMFFAPWLVPLQAAQGVWGAQSWVARDFMRLSKSNGQRSWPLAEAQRALHAADAQTNVPHAAASTQPPADAQESPPHAEAMEQFAELVRSHSQAVGGASPSHSDHASRRHKPRSRNRAAKSDTATRTRTASVGAKAKHKKRQAVRRMR